MLSEQIKSLRELDFNDYVKVAFDESTKNMIKRFCNSLSITETIVESESGEFLQKIAAELSIPVRKNLSVKVEDFDKLFSFIERQPQLPEFYLFLSHVKVKITGNEVFFIGPSSSLKSLNV